jgi:hypothetical protein
LEAFSPVVVISKGKEVFEERSLLRPAFQFQRIFLGGEKMKRFWLVLLSLGLVMAFSAQAFAVDVKFSGSFYAAGMYLDKTNVLKTDNNYTDFFLGPTTVRPGPSTAFYFQRLRVETEFVISPGLSMVTRFDAMERAWGATRTPAGTSLDAGSSGTTAENQNIAFDWVYAQWLSPIGYVMAGYMDDGGWGTEFGDSSTPLAKVQFATKLGDVAMGIYAGKVAELSRTANYPAGLADNDTDQYVAFVDYGGKNINAGLLYSYYRAAQYKAIPAVALVAYGYTPWTILAKAHLLNPYAKAKIGPVSIEAELKYLFGTGEYEDGLVGSDFKLSMLSAYIGANVDAGPVYLGGKFAYISGDNPDTSDKWEGGQIGGGWDWNPCLIMFNYDRSYWAGALPGYGGAWPPGAINGVDSGSGLFGAVGMTNAWFGQGFIGVRPTSALDIRLSVAYAAADQRPIDIVTATKYIGNVYGWEVDVVGNYKITKNLSYMVGFGYWFVGDYFKGYTTGNEVQNDYLIINKLTLTF